MSKKVPTPLKEKAVLPLQDPVLVRLENYSVFQNVKVRTFFGWIPSLLFLLVLADWLIGAGTFSRDVFRMTGVLTIAVILLVIQVLFDSLPRVLETVWKRELIGHQPGYDRSVRYLEYLDQLQTMLNSKYEWIVAVLCALGGLFATYPFQYLVKAKHFPFDLWGMFVYYFGGQAAVIAPVLGLTVGVLAWRVGVISYFIGRIAEKFPLNIQVKHIDQCGGFKPLGDLAFKIAVIILIPSIFLSVWGFITTIFSNPAFEVYVVIWGGLFRQMLVILGILSLFVFIQPLYKIHLRMEENARKIQGELDGLSREMERLSYELRSQASTLDPQQGEEKLKAMEFMKKVYEQNSDIPTWPFNWKTVISFSTAQVVPLLSFLGTSSPIIDVIKGLLKLGS